MRTISDITSDLNAATVLNNLATKYLADMLPSVAQLPAQTDRLVTGAKRAISKTAKLKATYSAELIEAQRNNHEA